MSCDLQPRSRSFHPALPPICLFSGLSRPCRDHEPSVTYSLRPIPFPFTLLRPLALFCFHKKLNSFLFNRFRTLRPKTRTRGLSPASIPISPFTPSLPLPLPNAALQLHCFLFVTHSSIFHARKSFVCHPHENYRGGGGILRKMEPHSETNELKLLKEQGLEALVAD